jgi:hypothetical protein
MQGLMEVVHVEQDGDGTSVVLRRTLEGRP